MQASRSRISRRAICGIFTARRAELRFVWLWNGNFAARARRQAERPSRHPRVFA